MINIAVCGANGRMGQEVIKAVQAADDMTLVARIDINNGQFATIKDAKDSVDIDILVDFTQPQSIYENALYCLNNNIIALCYKKYICGIYKYNLFSLFSPPLLYLTS